MNKTQQKISAVVVTHNRIEELKKVLNAICNQTKPVEQILIIDNASEVPVSKEINANNNVKVIRLDINCGGAGGFAKGIEEALKASADWIWLMDDDAVPQIDSLDRLMEEIPSINKKNEKIGFVCSAVYEDGQLALMHRRKFNHISSLEQSIKRKEYFNKFVPVQTASFVGFLLRAKVVDDVGLPNPELFLSYDDTEYSLRIDRAGFKNWLIPASKVDHLRNETSRMRNNTFSIKHYYNVRNRLEVAKHYANYKIVAVCVSIISAICIWIYSKDPINKKNMLFFYKAISDGMKGRLGKIDLTEN